jgi:hypothetical protein
VTVGGHIVRVGGKVQRSHGGQQSWVGVVRILVVVSSVTNDKVPVHFQVVASEEQERRWMRVRPPRFVHSCWLRWCCDVRFLLCEAGVRGLTVRLKVVHPVADEFGWSLKIAAGRGLAWHSGGIIDAVLGDFSLASLPG